MNIIEFARTLTLYSISVDSDVYKLEQKSYDDIVSKTKTYLLRLKELETLVEIGVPKKDAIFFNTPKWIATSGFSMGEEYVIRCNGKLIRRDGISEQEYARSCKWNAQHGLIVFSFTKKDLKLWLSLERKLQENRLYNRPCDELCKERSEVLLRSIDLDECVIKKNHKIK